MNKMLRDIYQLEDFVSDESFINYHFKTNKTDEDIWREWLIKNPQKKSLVHEAEEVIDSLSLNISQKEFVQELKKLTDVINKPQEHGILPQLKITTNPARFSTRRKRKIRVLVPVLLIGLAICGYLFFRPSKKYSEKFTETVNASKSPLILKLSDSSIVTLEPNSYLKYPLYFNGKDRNVYLHGDASFSVKRNVQHPFKVHVASIVTTVLGTVFNIKKSGDSAIVVELLKGKVEVELENTTNAAATPIILHPNEKATYVFHDKFIYKNPEVTTANVSFNKNSFDQIADRMKSVFDVTLINQSDKKKWRFTGEFKNSTANEIVENICLLKNLNHEVIGDTIFIKN
jgi:transmembrane sensor